MALLLTMSAISASDDLNNDTLIKESSKDTILANESTTAVENSTNTAEANNTANSGVVKTSVSTPDLGYVYKKNSYMKITINDKTTKKPIKNLKIKVKVYTKKKFKTYTLKTDDNGIAKLSTKKLKLGSHKFIITSANSNYKVSKKARLFIGYKKSLTLKVNKNRKLKSGDAIVNILSKKNAQYKKGVYTEVWYAGARSDIDPHYTMILKTKLYFKNKKTGKIISKTTKGKLFTSNGEIFRSLPSFDLIPGYKPVKAKVWYLTSK